MCKELSECQVIRDVADVAGVKVVQGGDVRLVHFILLAVHFVEIWEKNIKEQDNGWINFFGLLSHHQLCTVYITARTEFPSNIHCKYNLRGKKKPTIMLTNKTTQDRRRLCSKNTQYNRTIRIIWCHNIAHCKAMPCDIVQSAFENICTLNTFLGGKKKLQSTPASVCSTTSSLITSLKGTV